jgi:hypothetical protein
MKDDVRSLVQEGLYQDNLFKLMELCKLLFNESPSLYGSLIFMFGRLANEYDNQAIPHNRYELVMGVFQQPLLTILENNVDPAVFVNRLDNLFEVYFALTES